MNTKQYWSQEFWVMVITNLYIHSFSYWWEFRNLQLTGAQTIAGINTEIFHGVAYNRPLLFITRNQTPKLQKLIGYCQVSNLLDTDKSTHWFTHIRIAKFVLIQIATNAWVPYLFIMDLLVACEVASHFWSQTSL